MITKTTRKHCQSCRFSKCIRTGMQPTWVMTEEDKRAKKEKALKRRMEMRRKKKKEADDTNREQRRIEQEEVAVDREVKEEAQMVSPTVPRSSLLESRPRLSPAPWLDEAMTSSNKGERKEKTEEVKMVSPTVLRRPSLESRQLLFPLPWHGETRDKEEVRTNGPRSTLLETRPPFCPPPWPEDATTSAGGFAGKYDWCWQRAEYYSSSQHHSRADDAGSAPQQCGQGLLEQQQATRPHGHSERQRLHSASQVCQHSERPHPSLKRQQHKDDADESYKMLMDVLNEGDGSQKGPRCGDKRRFSSHPEPGGVVKRKALDEEGFLRAGDSLMIHPLDRYDMRRLPVPFAQEEAR